MIIDKNITRFNRIIMRNYILFKKNTIDHNSVKSRVLVAKTLNDI